MIPVQLASPPYVAVPPPAAGPMHVPQAAQGATPDPGCAGGCCFEVVGGACKDAGPVCLEAFLPAACGILCALTCPK